MLATILTRPNNTVIAAVRDPKAAVSQSLNELPKAEGTSLHLVKIDAPFQQIQPQLSRP